MHIFTRILGVPQICPEAWQIIGSTFERNIPSSSEGVGPTNGPTDAPFTEGLLRSILPLTAEQQVELTKELVSNPNFSKGKFKALAENYLARNQMKEYATHELGILGESYTTTLSSEIDSGGYDADWKQEAHPKLQKLIM